MFANYLFDDNKGAQCYNFSVVISVLLYNTMQLYLYIT